MAGPAAWAGGVMPDFWSLGLALVLTAAMVGAATLRCRGDECSWRWWGKTAWLLGWVALIIALVSPLDALGTNGLLSGHVAQHMVLGDIAAPLLLIGLPSALALRARRGCAALAERHTLAAFVLSPIGAVVVWAAVTCVWVTPPVHRLASPPGAVHAIDHVSFLMLGLLVWLAAFDFRTAKPVADWDDLKRAAWTCDLPWWARHVYAMVSRLAVIPAVTILWLAPTAEFYLSDEALPGGWSQSVDQTNAASMMLGFEILLAAFAVVLALIWVSVSEGRARDRAKDSSQ